MLRRYSSPVSWFLIMSDLCLTWAALWLADLTRRSVLPFGRELPPDTVYLTPAVYLAVGVIWLTVFTFLRVYSSGRRRAIDEMRAIISSISVSTVLFAGTIYFTRTRDFSRLLVAYFFAFDLIFLLGARWTTSFVSTLVRGGRVTAWRALIVGTGPTAFEVARRIEEHPWSGLRFVGFVGKGDEAHSSPGPIVGDTKHLRQLVQEHDAQCVIVALPISEAGETAGVLLCLSDLPVRLYIVPDYVGIVSLAPKVEDLYGVPLIGVSDLSIRGLAYWTKRALDVVIASIASLAGLPLFVLIAVSIRLDSPGPILFRQERVGQNGRRFIMLKFRSMQQGAEAMLEHIMAVRGIHALPLKLSDDPRVTRVGRILRRTSLDELPQLFNVIKGDMSLVGPRPEEPRIVQTYNDWQLKRLSVKPGLTGPMQVNGRADLCLDDRVRLELDYIQRYSLLEDMRLLAKTIQVVISGRGSY